MLEKIKEIPFIEESRAVKLYTKDNKLIMERYDRVIWAMEKTTLDATDIDCYVEASKFFNLLPDIATLSQSTCLTMQLKNGAKYELPFMSVQWQPTEMPEEYTDDILFKLDDLMLCTLKNLAKPELQCIYIDQQGAVSCDFVSACISTKIKSTMQMLLPPDVQELINARQCQVLAKEGKLYFKSSDFYIVTTNPTMTGDTWWEDLRAMIPDITTGTSATPLADSLRRLQLFEDYVSFTENRVYAGENFEPFSFTDLAQNKYEIEKLARILTSATSIADSEGNLVLKNESSKFLISPMEEA